MLKPLLPDRHPTPDFFICDIFDATPKGDMASMEHPIFSLSTKPDLRPRHYEHNGISISIKPSSDGLATVHDRDILIFCISHLVRAINAGLEPSPIVRFNASELLKSTNRMTTGRGYELLKSALERLRGTTISTNIITGGKEVFDTFGLIERARVVRETRDGRMQEIEVKLSDWVFNAIRAQEVLTLHRDYFRLRKPLERRIYELARKHCGHQRDWRISLGLLKKKCGSGSTSFEFKRLIGVIIAEDIEHDHMPDYALRFSEDETQVVFTNRGTVGQVLEKVVIEPLDPDIYDTARVLAPGWDVRMIEAEWRSWATEKPKNAESAFLGFCRKWYEKRGAP